MYIVILYSQQWLGGSVMHSLALPAFCFVGCISEWYCNYQQLLAPLCNYWPPISPPPTPTPPPHFNPALALCFDEGMSDVTPLQLSLTPPPPPYNFNPALACCMLQIDSVICYFYYLIICELFFSFLFAVASPPPPPPPPYFRASSVAQTSGTFCVKDNGKFAVFPHQPCTFSGGSFRDWSQRLVNSIGSKNSRSNSDCDPITNDKRFQKWVSYVSPPYTHSPSPLPLHISPPTLPPPHPTPQLWMILHSAAEVADIHSICLIEITNWF